MTDFCPINVVNPESLQHGSIRESTEAREARLLKSFQTVLELDRGTGGSEAAISAYEELVAKPELRRAKRGERSYELKYLCYRNLGAIYEKAESHQKAVESYIHALELNGSDVLLWDHVGTLATFELGNLRLGSHAFVQGLRRQPYHWVCKENLMRVLFWMGDFHYAKRIALDVLSVIADHAVALALVSYLETGRALNVDLPDCLQYPKVVLEKRANLRPSLVGAPVSEIVVPRYSWVSLGQSLLDTYTAQGWESDAASGGLELKLVSFRRGMEEDFVESDNLFPYEKDFSHIPISDVSIVKDEPSSQGDKIQEADPDQVLSQGASQSGVVGVDVRPGDARSENDLSGGEECSRKRSLRLVRRREEGVRVEVEVDPEETLRRRLVELCGVEVDYSPPETLFVPDVQEPPSPVPDATKYSPQKLETRSLDLLLADGGECTRGAVILDHIVSFLTVLSDHWTYSWDEELITLVVSLFRRLSVHGVAGSLRPATLLCCCECLFDSMTRTEGIADEEEDANEQEKPTSDHALLSMHLYSIFSLLDVSVHGHRMIARLYFLSARFSVLQAQSELSYAHFSRCLEYCQDPFLLPNVFDSDEIGRRNGTLLGPMTIHRTLSRLEKNAGLSRGVAAFREGRFVDAADSLLDLFPKYPELSQRLKASSLARNDLLQVLDLLRRCFAEQKKYNESVLLSILLLEEGWEEAMADYGAGRDGRAPVQDPLALSCGCVLRPFARHRSGGESGAAANLAAGGSLKTAVTPKKDVKRGRPMSAGAPENVVDLSSPKSASVVPEGSGVVKIGSPSTHHMEDENAVSSLFGGNGLGGNVTVDKSDTQEARIPESAGGLDAQAAPPLDHTGSGDSRPEHEEDDLVAPPSVVPFAAAAEKSDNGEREPSVVGVSSASSATTTQEVQVIEPPSPQHTQQSLRVRVSLLRFALASLSESLLPVVDTGSTVSGDLCSRAMARIIRILVKWPLLPHLIPELYHHCWLTLGHVLKAGTGQRPFPVRVARLYSLAHSDAARHGVCAGLCDDAMRSGRVVLSECVAVLHELSQDEIDIQLSQEEISECFELEDEYSLCISCRYGLVAPFARSGMTTPSSTVSSTTATDAATSTVTTNGANALSSSPRLLTGGHGPPRLPSSSVVPSGLAELPVFSRASPCLATMEEAAEVFRFLQPFFEDSIHDQGRASLARIQAVIEPVLKFFHALPELFWSEENRELPDFEAKRSALPYIDVYSYIFYYQALFFDFESDARRIRVFKKDLAINPERGESWLAIGTLCWTSLTKLFEKKVDFESDPRVTEQLEKTIRYFKAAARYLPGAVVPRAKLAYLYLTRYHWVIPRPSLPNFGDDEPIGSWDLSHRSGSSARASGWLTKALDWFDACCKLAPSEWTYHTMRGRLLWTTRGSLEDCLSSLTEGVRCVFHHHPEGKQGEWNSARADALFHLHSKRLKILRFVLSSTNGGKNVSYERVIAAILRCRFVPPPSRGGSSNFGGSSTPATLVTSPQQPRNVPVANGPTGGAGELASPTTTSPLSPKSPENQAARDTEASQCAPATDTGQGSARQLPLGGGGAAAALHDKQKFMEREDAYDIAAAEQNCIAGLHYCLRLCPSHHRAKKVLAEYQKTPSTAYSLFGLRPAKQFWNFWILPTDRDLLGSYFLHQYCLLRLVLQDAVATTDVHASLRIISYVFHKARRDRFGKVFCTLATLAYYCGICRALRESPTEPFLARRVLDLFLHLPDVRSLNRRGRKVSELLTLVKTPANGDATLVDTRLEWFLNTDKTSPVFYQVPVFTGANEEVAVLFSLSWAVSESLDPVLYLDQLKEDVEGKEKHMRISQLFEKRSRRKGSSESSDDEDEDEPPFRPPISSPRRYSQEPYIAAPHPRATRVSARVSKEEKAERRRIMMAALLGLSDSETEYDPKPVSSVAAPAVAVVSGDAGGVGGDARRVRITLKGRPTTGGGPTRKRKAGTPTRDAPEAKKMIGGNRFEGVGSPSSGLRRISITMRQGGKGPESRQSEFAQGQPGSVRMKGPEWDWKRVPTEVSPKVVVILDGSQGSTQVSSPGSTPTTGMCTRRSLRVTRSGSGVVPIVPE